MSPNRLTIPMIRMKRKADEPMGSFFLGIIEQRHQTVIHMELLMAMKQRASRIVGYEIEFDLLVAAQHYHILDDARGRFPGNPHQFETVAMQMHGMNIIAAV